MRTARKTVSAAAALVAMTGLAFAAVAYACTALATLSLSAPAGDPGSSVTVTGSGFAGAGAGAATAAPVFVHFGGIDGPVLAQATPDKSGSISAPVVIPQNAAPGAQVIVATQKNARGEVQSGTPARAPFQVGAAGPSAAAPQQAAPEGRTAPTSGDSGSTGIAIGAIGVVLFAGGLVTFLVARRQTGGARVRVGRS